MTHSIEPSVLATPEYRKFIDDLKARVVSARISAARSVNRDGILLYWDIGRGIVEKQRVLGWGDSVVEIIAADLRRAFPGTKGFSAQNVWRMKQFYLTHTAGDFLSQVVREIGGSGGARPGAAKLSQIVRELVVRVPWGHYANVLPRISDPAARLWYLRATARFGWTRNVLLNQIKAETYERAVTEKKRITSRSPCRSIWPSRPTKCSKAPTTLNSLAYAAPSRNANSKVG